MSFLGRPRNRRRNRSLRTPEVGRPFCRSETLWLPPRRAWGILTMEVCGALAPAVAERPAVGEVEAQLLQLLKLPEAGRQPREVLQRLAEGEGQGELLERQPAEGLPQRGGVQQRLAGAAFEGELLQRPEAAQARAHGRDVLLRLAAQDVQGELLQPLQLPDGLAQHPDIFQRSAASDAESEPGGQPADPSRESALLEFHRDVPRVWLSLCIEPQPGKGSGLRAALRAHSAPAVDRGLRLAQGCPLAPL